MRETKHHHCPTMTAPLVAILLLLLLLPASIAQRQSDFEIIHNANRHYHGAADLA
jgi:hypothetical protein